MSAPRPVGASKKDLQERKKARTELPKILNTNLQAACKEKFPGVVEGAKICKWEAAAEREKWDELPKVVQNRMSRTTNSWRLKLGLPAKGRPQGGAVPECLQRELDLLIGEMSVGLSRVSERKEVVTVECVVSSQQFSALAIVIVCSMFECLTHKSGYPTNYKGCSGYMVFHV